jgi:DNA adenine methylase
LTSTIVEQIGAVPDDRIYFEPFLGGGSLFFSLCPTQARLSDANEELIRAFVSVRDEVEKVIDHLRRWEYDELSYYKIRSSKPRSNSGAAARFIYLNKTCFNGLYRVNKRGEFNVPFGRHGDSLLVCDRTQLRSASQALQNARLRAEDFEEAVKEARAADVVYFDPPYTTAHTNNGFIEYNARVFSWADQRRLAAVAGRLAEKGVTVVLSNAWHPSIRDLYGPRFRPYRIRRHSTIGATPSRRFATSELLLISSG